MRVSPQGCRLLGLLCAALLCIGSNRFALAASADSSSVFSGKLIWPDEVRQADIRLQLTLDGGQQRLAWPLSNGKFSFQEVPKGSHLLDILAVDLLYPQFIVDVQTDSAQDEDEDTLVRFADQPKKTLSSPLIIRPVMKAEYFEKRQPFSIISFVKTPYGLMILFGLFVVVVLPKLKVDPEELEAAEAESSAAQERLSQQTQRLTGQSRGSQRKRD